MCISSCASPAAQHHPSPLQRWLLLPGGCSAAPAPPRIAVMVVTRDFMLPLTSLAFLVRDSFIAGSPEPWESSHAELAALGAEAPQPFVPRDPDLHLPSDACGQSHGRACSRPVPASELALLSQGSPGPDDRSHLGQLRLARACGQHGSAVNPTVSPRQVAGPVQLM